MLVHSEKNEISVIAFVVFRNFSNKSYCNLSCGINSHLSNSRSTMVFLK